MTVTVQLKNQDLSETVWGLSCQDYTPHVFAWEALQAALARGADSIPVLELGESGAAWSKKIKTRQDCIW